MIAAIEALAQSIPLSQACAVFDFPRSSLYRSRQPQPTAGKTPRPPPARALSAKERATVREVLDGERFADQSPYEVYASLLDEGIYHCSIRTMYRILHDAGEVQERTNPAEFRVTCQAFGDQVFHRLDVMIGPPLDIFDAACIVRSEALGEPVQHFIGNRGEPAKPLDAGFLSQKLDPANLGQHAKTDEAVFAENASQGFRL